VCSPAGRSARGREGSVEAPITEIPFYRPSTKVTCSAPALPPFYQRPPARRPPWFAAIFGIDDPNRGQPPDLHVFGNSVVSIFSPLDQVVSFVLFPPTRSCGTIFWFSSKPPECKLPPIMCNLCRCRSTPLGRPAPFLNTCSETKLT